MAAKIRNLVPAANIDLIRGRGGDFIVIAEGEELWNKNSSGRGFPDESVLADIIAARAS